MPQESGACRLGLRTPELLGANPSGQQNFTAQEASLCKLATLSMPVVPVGLQLCRMPHAVHAEKLPCQKYEVWVVEREEAPPSSSRTR